MGSAIAAATIEPISGLQLRAARQAASEGSRAILDVLKDDLGVADGAEVLRRLGETLRYPVLTIADLHAAQPAFDLLPYAEALQRGSVAVYGGAGQIQLAVSDPFNASLMDWAEDRFSIQVSIALALASDIAAYLAIHSAGLKAVDSLVDDASGAGSVGTNVEDISLRSISEDASPTIRLVNSTLYDAIRADASDIHVENTVSGAVIKYRIDGVLSQALRLDGKERAEQVISRIKVVAELDIAERRVPQDGRFKVTISGRDVDFRVSIMPGAFGEDAVLRILDKQALVDQMNGLRLEGLGFDASAIETMRTLASEPYGMLLVTGPTGSGKTTTLYTVISEINDGQSKIITIEDPVEYQLSGVLQIPVNERKGLTFARGLRSILRHDPDTILVGEIRDPETAQIAMQSALTGHLVFTSVHANNVFDVIGRLIHMQLDPYSFVSALNGVVAQRLVRKVCSNCAVPDTPDEKTLRASRIAPEDLSMYRFVRGQGCGACRGTGYRGRRAIAEILVLTDEVRELIVSREPIRRLKEAAKANGTRFLRDAALDLVRAGETSLTEINRVTFVA